MGGSRDALCSWWLETASNRTSWRPPELSQAVALEGGSLDGLRYNFNREYGHTAPLIVENEDLSRAPALSALSEGDIDLRSQSAVIYGLSSKVAGGGHGSGYGALSSSASRGGVPTGISIDAWLSQAPKWRLDTLLQLCVWV